MPPAKAEGTLFQKAYYFRDSGAAIGGAMLRITTQISNLPVADCHLPHGQKHPGSYEPGCHCLGEVRLLQGLLNSNSHGNGHTDHGVVTCAQEAHHLNVKSACRRLSACGAGAFGAGSPTFHKTRSTSHESGMLCFPSMGTSYHIMCSRNKVF